MTLNETRLKNIPPVLDEWLTSQAAIAGIAKTKYIIQVLEDLRSNAGQTHPQLSPKVSPKSLVDVNIYEEVAAIKARLTKLEQGSPNDSPDQPQFYEGQEITGQSAKTYRLLWNSFETSQKVDRTEYHLSNKLGIICKVVGSSKAGKKKLSIWVSFPGDKVVIQDDGTFLTKKGNGKLGWAYEEVEPTLAEPTALLDPTNDETPIETVIEAPTPLDEPVEQAADIPALGDTSGDSLNTELSLSRDQLVQRIAKTPNEAKSFSATLTNLGGAKMKPAAIVKWTSQHDPDGKAWLPTDATREAWVMQAATNTP